MCGNFLFKNTERERDESEGVSVSSHEPTRQAPRNS